MERASGAGGQELGELASDVALGGVEDEALLLAALHEAGAAEQVEVVRERGALDAHVALDVARRHLVPGFDQEEEDLEAGAVGQRLERLHMEVAGGEA